MGASFATATAVEVQGQAGLRDTWERMLVEVHPLNRVYASPDWFEHRRRTNPVARMHLVILSGEAGRILGVCPLEIRNATLSYEVAARPLARAKLVIADVLGSQPMLAGNPQLLAELVEGIHRAFPDCDALYFDALPLDSECWTILGTDSQGKRPWLTYVPRESRPWRWIELADRFDGYLAQMKGKTRNTLRRQIRDLEKQGGQLRFTRIEEQGQVEAFLASVGKVRVRTWQNRVAGPRMSPSESEIGALYDLAGQGMLRSYLLEADAKPCAFVIGYQYGGVYQFAETGFDEQMADLSPGTVSLYYLIEDLHRINRPTALNFGVGDGPHKRRFANRESKDASPTSAVRGVETRFFNDLAVEVGTTFWPGGPGS